MPARELTPRERDVLRLLALGYTNAQTAAALGLSVRTVETHRARVADKLGTRARSEFVRYAFRAGLLEDLGA